MAPRRGRRRTGDQFLKAVRQPSSPCDDQGFPIMGDVLNLIVRRVITGALALLLVVTFIFFFMRFAGDPVALIAGEEATQAQVDAAMARYGFDRPAIEQYLDFLRGMLQGDFGISLRYDQPAMGLVLERLPATMRLAGIAIAIAVLVAVPIGIYSALRPGSMVDSASRVFAVVGQSMPSFWLGILFIVLFSVTLGVLPSGGSGSWRHLVLPAAALAVYSVPLTMRLVRSSMLEVLNQEYMKMARAKGLSERTVIIRHGFRNAAIPVITVIALRLGFLITGSIVLEQVFSYPGLGRLAISSMQLRDYPVIQAFVFVVAFMVIAVNLIVDILYGLVDPRVRVD